jgi:hypothetical protein
MMRKPASIATRDQVSGFCFHDVHNLFLSSRRIHRSGGRNRLMSLETPERMTAEQLFKEIEALPKSEREHLVQRMRDSGSSDIPQDSSTRWPIR